MLTADLADTPLASFMPDIAGDCDTLADRMREALAPYGPREKHAAAFAALDRVLDGADGLSESDRKQIVVEAFRAAYRDTSHEPSVRIIAAAALKRMGKDGRSYQGQADEFGVTRACLHAHSRRIEKKTGLKCRADKPDAQRRGSAESARTRLRPERAPTSGILRRPRGLFAMFRLQ